MIQGAEAKYHPAYYFVLDDLVWRYDGMCVDRCINQGRARSEAEFRALNERIAQARIYPPKIIKCEDISSLKQCEESTEGAKIDEYRAYRTQEIMGYFRA